VSSAVDLREMQRQGSRHPLFAWQAQPPRDFMLCDFPDYVERLLSVNTASMRIVTASACYASPQRGHLCGSFNYCPRTRLSAVSAC
jgi:hypothetical protein